MYYLDLLKDTILAVELVKIVGGWDYISNNASEFMPAVSFITNIHSNLQDRQLKISH